jgi:hypothetical protein
MRENIVGGASIVFHRYHEAGITKIQQLHYDVNSKTWWYENDGKFVKKIIGLDMNALYLWCIAQFQLCGILKYYDGALIDWNTLIQRILDETFWGCVEVDIEVPEHLYEYFSIEPPLYINVTYSSELAGEYMDWVIKKLGKKHTTNRKLICSMKATKILLKSNLIKWYLEHGLIITKIYGYIPAIKAKLYEEFANWVSDSRRAGDVKDESGQKPYAVKAENCKNIGNSAYGSTIMNKSKHKTCKYVDAKEFNKMKNDHWFLDAEEYGDNFEVVMTKKNIMEDTAVQVGFGILQDSKLKMLQLTYDCIDKYIDRSDYQKCNKDTDSDYSAFAGESIEELIKPHMREKWERDKHNWFPRTDTPEHAAYDARTPGLAKTEKEGIGMIALCSKTNCLKRDPNDPYYDGDKITCKGGQHKRNRDKLIWNNYKETLDNQVLIRGDNAGIRYVDHHMQTYIQPKIILNPIYVKGVVMNDGIHIRPLIL